MGSRARLLLVVAGVATAFITPMQEKVSAQSGPGIVITEFRFSGPLSGSTTTPNNEFIELFNASSSPINIGGWTLQSSNNVVPPTVAIRATVPAGTTINSGCFYLFGNSNTGGYVGTGTAKADLNYTVGFADDGGAAIVNAGAIVDQVGFGPNGAFGEGTRLTVPAPSTLSRSFERKSDPIFAFQDTNNNAADFSLISPPTPQNSTAPCVNFKVYLPHEIQGAGSVSPLAAGTPVLVRGVVTARKAGGFFLQTEDGSEDADPNSSEGLFVSFPGAVSVGHLVKVIGKVSEFVPPADPGSAPMTQLNLVTSVQDLGSASVMPVAHVLTSSDLSDAGTLDQLERFEGMRVNAAWLTAVSGSDLDGSFFAVLTGQPRPFREPGVHAANTVLPCAIGPCNVPVFDGNPELLRVDSDGLLGVPALALSTGAVMSNVTGPLEFAARAYTLLPESLSPAGGMSIVAAPAASVDQFTVASLNLGAPYAARLAKASQAVRNVLNFPDVVGVQGVDDLSGLVALSNQIDSDAAAASQPVPSYQAYVIDGLVASNTDTGFLVKTANGRVTSAGVEQIGADLHEHPPLVLRAQVNGPSTRLPQAITVIVNQSASLTDVERDDATGAAARAKRQAQAELLADYVQGLQINNPNEAIVSLGDYNAFEFNDGYVDVVGTVRGLPASPDTVNLASSAVVSPVLLDADASNPSSERYASLLNGSAASLDHVLVSANLAGQLAGLAHARLNADFPAALRDDATTPARLSDRDPLVLYVTFPPDLTAPAFDATPQDVVVEATSPDGAVVNFETPSAHDNLDPSVTVNCAPLSGGTFALGNTAVTCSTQDLAGNPNSVSFTVTVQDTTAPVVAVPPDQVVEATSAAGAALTFTATATDAASVTVPLVCSPVSGSTFALGTTTVVCSALDASGNSGSGLFNVTVRDTTAPSLLLPSHITEEATSSAGRAVSYVASAADVVTASPVVSCSPASGSTFPVGDTQVSCSASDAAGNTSNGSFVVTITAPASDPVFGRMGGAGDVVTGQHQTWFAFDVRGAANVVERGSVALMVRDGNGRPNRFVATSVSDVLFSNSEGYEPGRFPRSGVDTVSFKGVGLWNGQTGYRFEVTASDRGEPGRGTDTFSVTVFAPNGAVVESASGTLRDGNIQSLR